jgi:hypothetical protein
VQCLQIVFFFILNLHTIKNYLKFFRNSWEIFRLLFIDHCKTFHRCKLILNDSQLTNREKIFFYRSLTLHRPKDRSFRPKLRKKKFNVKILLTSHCRRFFRQTIFFFFNPLRATIFLNQRRRMLNFTRTIRNTTGGIAIIPQHTDHHHLETILFFASLFGIGKYFLPSEMFLRFFFLLSICCCRHRRKKKIFEKDFQDELADVRSN